MSGVARSSRRRPSWRSSPTATSSGGLAANGLDDRAQLALWGVVIVGALVYAIRARGSLPSVTAGLNVFAVVLVVIAGTSIVPYELRRAGRPPITLAPAVLANATRRTTRDIYFLIFDRYGSAEAIDRRFGIKGNDLYDWLRGRGFQVPAHSHANYRATDFSLAATLNMRYLDELTQTIGPNSGDRTPAQAMFKDHAVGEFLKGEGYRYYQLGTWFGPTRSIPIADENLALGATSEFETVLNDTTVMPAIDRVLGRTTPELTFFDRHREGTLFELRQLTAGLHGPGPEVRVRAHPPAPRPVRVPGRRLVPHGGARPRPRPTSARCTTASSPTPTRRSRPSSTTSSRGPRPRARS